MKKMPWGGEWVQRGDYTMIKIGTKQYHRKATKKYKSIMRICEECCSINRTREVFRKNCHGKVTKTNAEGYVLIL